MTTVAILPVKRFELAKQRLGAALDSDQRRRLAEAMVGDVLAALRATSGLDGILVVTRQASVGELAANAGAEVVEDVREDGQSAAAEQGIARALELGAERVLLVPGDCPSLDPDELQALLAGAPRERPSVTIVPDRHGTGTNALLISPPGTLAPSFGPDSFERHRRDAHAAGVAHEIARPASLLLDIDTGEDLAALRARLESTPGLAARTRAALDQI
jgi:2-phospho-L-lactate/phosphoenolpyruvate guanylyltransferase